MHTRKQQQRAKTKPNHKPYTSRKHQADERDERAVPQRNTQKIRRCPRLSPRRLLLGVWLRAVLLESHTVLVHDRPGSCFSGYRAPLTPPFGEGFGEGMSRRAVSFASWFSASVLLMSAPTSMDSLVGDSTSTPGRLCCSPPELAAVESTLELLPRVVGMLGVCCLLCGGVAILCGVFLWCVRALVVLCAKTKLSTCTAVCCLPVKKHTQDRNVRICICQLSEARELAHLSCVTAHTFNTRADEIYPV